MWSNMRAQWREAWVYGVMAAGGAVVLCILTAKEFIETIFDTDLDF